MSEQPHEIPSGRAVLIVEDETRLREMLVSAVSKMGFRATGVASAEAALRTCRQTSFDILILDLNLPGESGIDFLARIRKGGISERDKDVQAIILTGFGDLPVARQAIHLDVVEFLTKPCQLGELEAALGKAYARRRGSLMTDHQPSATFAIERREPKTPPKSSSPDTSQRVAGPLDDLERDHILAVLQKHSGNRAATAAELGISLRKLYYRLGDYQRQGLL